ncbi:MAG: hypothetical protein IJH39_12190 [Clostridia bacterium]|nr:hypothetical protein [Clostridia bacterium]
MKQNIIWTPKFKVGNIIKYFGDIYEITGINQYGYDVNVIEYRDQEDVKTGLGRNVEHIMEFIAEHREKKEKKFYPVFRMDVCFTGYAMHYILVGAENVGDLIAHIHNFLTDDDLDYGAESVDELALETSRFEEVKDMYTDKPYVILDSFSYYE